MFETPRASEYLSVRELQTMTGQPSARFADVVLKELCDNALDAAETAKTAPVLDIDVAGDGGLVRITTADNGAGIHPDTLRRVLNFHTHTSDKAAYRSPTRGLQGNALKTVFGIPYALGCPGTVRVEARGTRHDVRVRLDPSGEVRVEHDRTAVAASTGTRFTLSLPAASCTELNAGGWAMAFALFNPHATVRFRQKGIGGEHGNTAPPPTPISYQPTVAFPGTWRKFLPTDLTSPWWYDRDALARLVFLHVALARAGGNNPTLRQFVQQFRGLSGTAASKRVCDQFRAITRLSDFDGHEEAVPALLLAMRRQARAPSPDVLGLVGEAHFRKRFDDWYGIKRHWYKQVRLKSGGVPFVAETFVAETDEPGDFFHGVNFSPTFDDPLAGTFFTEQDISATGVGGFLQRAGAHPHDEERQATTAAAVHLICPSLVFLDKGKTRLRLPSEMASAVSKALWDVAKTLYREEERRKRDAARQARADRNRELPTERREMSLKDAVFTVLPQAVSHATGGAYPVSVHTLFYSVRRLIQEYTDRELDSHYCEQDLIPTYQRQHGPLLLPDSRPALYYEPRGTLYEPHTGQAVPLGTREVESYVFPAWLYDKILFIEKQGLWPVFQAAQIAERFDMAVLAGEGYATEACRVLFANAQKGRRYQLFVLHDADPHGYNIARTLSEETARMPGHNIEVVDLGLKLDDALEMGLETESFTRKKALPAGLQLTAQESACFGGERSGAKSWIGRRVELNAFDAPGLLAYTTRQLEKNDIRGKVIPPADVLRQQLEEETHRRVREAVQERILREAGWERQVEDAVGRMSGILAERADGLAAEVAGALDKEPLVRWDNPIGRIAAELAEHTAFGDDDVAGKRRAT
jgi:hypothetical protein